MLGFGFNKDKVRASAERYVQQGKLQNAVAEYERILKEDPKDLNVINTIGDLYSRLGRIEQAVACFKKVGDNYASEGFTVKAIAMYKKLTKLSPSSLDSVQKLADLYIQQGLYSDARAQYLSIADSYLHSNALDDAARILKKILDLDPDNLPAQAKLADIYLRQGKKEDAKRVLLSAAESLHQRNLLDAADDALRRLLHIDAQNLRALELRGQIAMERGDPTAAIKTLEVLPDIDSRPDALRCLLRGYVHTQRYSEAESAARKLAVVYGDASGVLILTEKLIATSPVECLRLFQEFADRLLPASAAAVTTQLRSCLSRLKEDPVALDAIYLLFQRAGNTSDNAEVLELIAHVAMQRGDFTRARDIYKQLSEQEPENPAHMQNYRQVLGRLGEDAVLKPSTEEDREQAFLRDTFDAVPATSIEQEHTPQVEDAILTAVAEADVRSTHKQTAQAIAILEAVLPQAPEDVRLNRQLASLYADLGHFTEAAEHCRLLQRVYQAAGQSADAQLFAETARDYDRKAGTPSRPAPASAPEIPAFDLGSPAPPAAEFEISSAAPQPSPAIQEFSFEAPPEAPAPPAPAPAPPVVKPPSAPASIAHEIDLSEEWESAWQKEISSTPPPVAPPPLPSPVAAPVPEVPSLSCLLEETRFYISQSMWHEAQNAVDKLDALAPSHPELADFRRQLAAAQQPPAAPAAVAPPAAQESSVSTFVFDEEPPAPKPAAAAPLEPMAPAPAEFAEETSLSDFVLDLDASLGDDFVIGGPAAPAPLPPPPPPATVTQLAPVAAAPIPPPAIVPAAAVAVQPPVPESSVELGILSDLFEEFKEDVGDAGEHDDDPETHYNLGVAFKEMGLLDEAIGELQKVCHLVDQGGAFPHVIQAYTWLAGCFVEKGIPEAAFKWYDKALQFASDEQTRTAIHYELASAYELAGKKPEALQHFMEVYTSNIDYRDVGERIRALRS